MENQNIPPTGDTPSQPINPTNLPQERVSKSKKPLLISVFIVVGLLLIGASVFAYSYFSSPSPKKIVNEMFEKMPEVKSFGYKLDLKSELSETPGASGIGSIGAVDVSLGLDGAIDLNDSNNINNSVALDLRINATSPSLQPILSLGLEERNIGSDVYLKLTEIPTALPIPVDLSSLLNQWIKLDAKTYIDQSGLGEQLSAERDISADQKKRIAELRSKIIKITEVLPSESMGGVSTHHYSFEIDKDALSNSIVEISSILDRPMNEAEISSLNNGLESMQSISGEAWIGKSDNLLYKFILNIPFDETNNPNPIKNINISYLAWDYNKSVQIDIPESFKTIEEVMADIFSTSMEGINTPTQFDLSTPEGRDEKRIEDLEEINRYLTRYYIKCGSNPGEGMEEGEGCTKSNPQNWDEFSNVLSSTIGVDIPNDPDTTKTYFFGVRTETLSYLIGVNLEGDNEVLRSLGEIDSTHTDGFTMWPPNSSCSDPAPHFGYCLGQNINF